MLEGSAGKVHHRAILVLEKRISKVFFYQLKGVRIMYLDEFILKNMYIPIYLKYMYIPIYLKLKARSAGHTLHAPSVSLKT